MQLFLNSVFSFFAENFPVFWRVTGLYYMDRTDVVILLAFILMLSYVVGWIYDLILGSDSFGPFVNGVVLFFGLLPSAYFYGLLTEPLHKAEPVKSVFILLVCVTMGLMGSVFIGKLFRRH